jgi:hypothetical protein
LKKGKSAIESVQSAYEYSQQLDDREIEAYFAKKL